MLKTNEYVVGLKNETNEKKENNERGVGERIPLQDTIFFEKRDLQKGCLSENQNEEDVDLIFSYESLVEIGKLPKV